MNVQNQIPYQNDVVTIIKRGALFLVIHSKNARWYVTDQLGAELIVSALNHMEKVDGPVPCSLAEAIYLRRLITKHFFHPPVDMPVHIPNVVCLSLTERCNLECDYCFYSASYRDSRALHVEDPPHHSVSLLFEELRRMNPKARVYLTGGEPFMHRDIFDFLALIKSNSLYAGVVTNGTLLNRKKVEHLGKIGVDEVRISLDGVHEKTHNATRPGTFRKVMKAIDLLEDFSIRVVISMTVTTQNEHEIQELSDFAANRGFALNFSHVVPTGRAAKKRELLPDYEELVRQIALAEKRHRFGFFYIENSQGLRRHTCGLAGQSLYVNLKGETEPCNMLAKTKHRIGNVFVHGLARTLCSEGARRVRVPVDEMSSCSDCYIRYICGGSCRASSYFALGAMNTRGPDCRFKYSEIIESMFCNAPYWPAAKRNMEIAIS